MTDAEILRAARDIIAKRGAWCQGAMARTRDGREIWPEASSAVKWCGFGAVLCVIRKEDVLSKIPPRIRHLLAVSSGSSQRFCGFSAWNDDLKRTKRQVLAAFDKAIEAARKAPNDV